jgi:hypothetical protein
LRFDILFTREELTRELPRLMAVSAPPLEAVLFTQQHFYVPDSEECIRAFRGSKCDFPDALLFWIKTLQSQDWGYRQQYFAPYVGLGLCEAISAAQFAELVASHSEALAQPLPSFLTDLDGFRKGLRMYAEWYDVAAVAELRETYVAFCWSTTA